MHAYEASARCCSSCNVMDGKKEQETDKSEERRSEGKMQKKGKKRKAGLDGKRGQGGFVFWGFSSHETKHKTSLESDDAPVQRLDSL